MLVFFQIKHVVNGFHIIGEMAKILVSKFHKHAAEFNMNNLAVGTEKNLAI